MVTEEKGKNARYLVFRDNEWCERGDLNPHGLPRQILSLVRLPFRHSRVWEFFIL